MQTPRLTQELAIVFEKVHIRDDGEAVTSCFLATYVGEWEPKRERGNKGGTT